MPSLVELLTVNGQLSLVVVGLLSATAFATAMLTAMVGVGGGVVLLAVMASCLPPVALIPVHGLVQCGANANRALLTWRHIDWRLLGWFAGGAVGGAALASQIVIQLPLHWLQISVAGFMLWLVWGPQWRMAGLPTWGHSLMGALTTFISMFVGATGPLVAAFIHKAHADKLTTTATFAACMRSQHVLKGWVFSAVGFAFVQWLPLIALLIVAGFAGTWLGLRVLLRIPARLFTRLFSVVVTLLAVRLLYTALNG